MRLAEPRGPGHCMSPRPRPRTLSAARAKAARDGRGAGGAKAGGGLSGGGVCSPAVVLCELPRLEQRLQLVL